MKPYLLSLGAGLLVGIVYALINVRSPAPPIVALVGLFGILLGEQIPTLAKRLWGGDRAAIAQAKAACAHHMLGALPDGKAALAASVLKPANPKEGCPS
jgi:XapX domain-containing protein